MLLQTCVINICIQTDLVYFDPLVVYLPSLIFPWDRPDRAVNVMGSHFVFKGISAYETQMADISNSRKLSRQKFHNYLALEFTAYYAFGNAEWDREIYKY